MRGLWFRLLLGGRRTAYIEAAFPVAAGALITVVLLFMVGLQQGLDQRADRTAWLTPEVATGSPTAIQAGYTDYVDERPVAVVELAQVGADPPAVPGTTGFPAPGEVWASPALAEEITSWAPDRLGARFPGSVTAILPPAALEHPDDLVAVVGLTPSEIDQIGRAPHLWNSASSVAPTPIDRWSTEPSLYHTTYRDAALLAVVLTALPLAGLGSLAARLTAGRRRRRLATLRLLGASVGQITRMTVAELVTLVGVGALVGVALHRLALPVASQVSIKGGPWFTDDVDPGGLTLLVAAAVVLALCIAALAGTRPSIRDPLGTYRRRQGESLRSRWWGALFVLAAVMLFWFRSSNEYVTVAFTILVLIGWGLVTVGPAIVAGVGRLFAWRAADPVTLLAGRRLADSPGALWRAVSGFVLAAFLAGFVASALPAGLGQAEGIVARADQLDAVVPAATIADTVRDARSALSDAGIDADVVQTQTPVWLDAREWTTLTVAAQTPPLDLDRARTVLIDQGLWGPEMRLAEELPTLWLVLDGVVISALVIPLAVLVALGSMIIGALARILDERETLVALRLIGTSQDTLRSALRRELVVPVAVAASVAAVGGFVGGMALGVVNPLNPWTAGLLLLVIGVGCLALWSAERATGPVLERVGKDLAERE